MDHSSLHEFIISSFLKNQRPPTVGDIATRFESDVTTARQGLRALADYHGVVLHPQSDEVWVAHPFSAAPTTCIVTSGHRKWWGNCAWCSLGVMHLAGGTSTLTTRIGAIGDEVSVTVRDGQLLDTDFVIHFPVPMRHAWDNVIYTCSVQLLFRNEAEVDEWCATRGIAKGDVRPIKQIWDFAAEWYGRHADADWTKWTLPDAAEIFARHRLTGPTWAIGDEAGRF
ncbi:alkylmercury lyase domain protein [Metarhizium robertsii]|uniref:RSp1117 protein product n=2 Tax=Metarhizium robertsii TaxID=568076 RepID=E9ESU1_METRA|nr:RSp1117 protein product [Metarhizium robertsii ARSEF 23]EFZ01964.1 RSp1117 protein product [Metarhizium robertsii ARSEF 23]EXV02474.1 alkylmercury lyase domain protein [Metarhizium robertsii]